MKLDYKNNSFVIDSYLDYQVFFSYCLTKTRTKHI